MKITETKLRDLYNGYLFIKKWTVASDGEAWMTSLYDVDKKLYVSISDTDNDPFRDDNKIDKFFDYLLD